MSDTELQQPIDVRYKLAAADVLENLRNHGEGRLTEVMTKYDCLLPAMPTEEQLAAWNKFREDIYPALPRLKDLRAKTLEALHLKAKDPQHLSAETVPNLTALLKTLDHDIEEISSGSMANKGTTNVFIFNDKQANRIAARLTGRTAEADSYSVEEESD